MKFGMFFALVEDTWAEEFKLMVELHSFVGVD